MENLLKKHPILKAEIQTYHCEGADHDSPSYMINDDRESAFLFKDGKKEAAKRKLPESTRCTSLTMASEGNVAFGADRFSGGFGIRANFVSGVVVQIWSVHV